MSGSPPGRKSSLGGGLRGAHAARSFAGADFKRLVEVEVESLAGAEMGPELTFCGHFGEEFFIDIGPPAGPNDFKPLIFAGMAAGQSDADQGVTGGVGDAGAVGQLPQLATKPVA